MSLYCSYCVSDTDHEIIKYKFPSLFVAPRLVERKQQTEDSGAYAESRCLDEILRKSSNKARRSLWFCHTKKNAHDMGRLKAVFIVATCRAGQQQSHAVWVTVPACTSFRANPPSTPSSSRCFGYIHLCRTAWHSRAGAPAATRCMQRRARLLLMQNPRAQESAARTRAAQAREQGLQDLQAEPAQAPTPAPALPPSCAWTNLLRNELATDVGDCALGAGDGGAPCAALCGRVLPHNNTWANKQRPLPTRRPSSRYRAAQISLSHITEPSVTSVLERKHETPLLLLTGSPLWSSAAAQARAAGASAARVAPGSAWPRKHTACKQPLSPALPGGSRSAAQCLSARQDPRMRRQGRGLRLACLVTTQAISSPP